MLPIAWWMSIIWLGFTQRAAVDVPGLLFAILFVVPFALTNSDPRFRLPLEPVYAISLMKMFSTLDRRATAFAA